MVRLLRLLCVGSLIVGITAAAAGIGPVKPPTPPASLQFDSSSYAFGTQPIGEPVYKTLTVTNLGGEKAENIASLLSGTGFEFRGGSFPGNGGNCGNKLNAGHDCRIIIRFLSYDAGNFNGTLRLTYFNSAQTVSVTVALSATAAGAANLVASPNPLDFGDVLNGTTKTLSVIVTNSGGWMASSLKLEKIKNGFTLVSSNCSGSLGANQNCKVDIRFAPFSSVAYSETLVLKYENGSDKVSLNISLTGRGTGVVTPPPPPDPDPVPTLVAGPDETFGAGGWTRVDGLAGLVYPRAVAVTAGGSVLVAATDFNTGYQNMMVVRLNSSGQLDGTFGDGGRTWVTLYGIDDQANALALQADGKILLAGYGHNGDNTDLCVVRLSADGILDTGFNGGLGWRCVDGGFNGNDQANSIAVQADGKILLGGTAMGAASEDFVTVRFNSDGTLDSGYQGVRFADFASDADNGMSLGLQSNGGVLLAGQATVSGHRGFGATRWSSAGSRDTAFGQGGFVYAQPATLDGGATGLSVRTDNSAVLGGSVQDGASSRFGLVGLTSSGLPDGAFGSSGLLTTSFADGAAYLTGLTAISDSLLMAAGYVTGSDGFDRFAFAAYKRDGSADTTHWPSGNFVWNTDDGTQRRIAAVAYDAANARVIAVGTWMDDSSIRIGISAYRYETAP